MKHGMKANAFLRALRAGRWERVTTEGDFGRIVENIQAASESDADGCDIGFALRGSPTRVIWADVEVIRTGIRFPEEYPPNVPPGSEMFDIRVAGYAFVEHPDAEPSELRPSRSANRPWFLTNYPGRVSWARLVHAAERLCGPIGDWRGLKYGEPFAYWWRGRRWARLLARSPSEVVDVFDRDGNRICSGLLTRQPEGRAALVPDHHYVTAHYAERGGHLMTHRFVPWPSMHMGAT